MLYKLALNISMISHVSIAVHINNQLWGYLNPSCLVLFYAVDVVGKQNYVEQTIESARHHIPQSVQDMTFDRFS